jgi:hypothetical protein
VEALDMTLTIDHGRRFEHTDDGPQVVEQLSTRADDDRPARCGFRLVRVYHRPALGPMWLWARAFLVYPTEEPTR